MKKKEYSTIKNEQVANIVEEPLISYGITTSLLHSDLEIVSEARKGVQTKMFWDFLKAINSSKAEFEELLPSSLKTFSRKKILDEATGERILNIIKVFSMGEKVFQDISKFKNWLKKYNPIIGDEPRNYLNTSTGCQVVIQELGRAQHGVMA
ncbi:MAG: DUF2384 domain-containing protein [Cyclobacteriaceae bacterium]